MTKLRRGFEWTEDRVRIEENSMIQIIKGQIGEVEKTGDLAKTVENRFFMAFESDTNDFTLIV